MTLQRYLMEGGADGDTATTANTGAALIFPGNGSITFATARGRNGKGLNFTSAAGAQTEARWNAAAANTTMAFRGWYFSPPTLPSDMITLCTFRHSGGVVMRVKLKPTGDVVLEPSSGADVTLASGTAANSQFDLSIRLVVGTSGSITAVLRSATGVQLGTVTSSTFNSGTNAVVAVGTGIVGSFTNAYTTGWDEISLDDGATTEIPLYTPPEAPTGGMFDLVWTGAEWR